MEVPLAQGNIRLAVPCGDGHKILLVAIATMREGDHQDTRCPQCQTEYRATKGPKGIKPERLY